MGIWLDFLNIPVASGEVCPASRRPQRANDRSARVLGPHVGDDVFDAIHRRPYHRIPLRAKSIPLTLLDYLVSDGILVDLAFDDDRWLSSCAHQASGKTSRLDESRQRVSVIHATDLIITASRALSHWVRLRDRILTFALWLLYLWLISDVFVIALHLFQWLFFEKPQPEEWARVAAILTTLGSYAGIVIANAALLLAWALYNQIRFRGRERRKSAPAVSREDLAQMYGFPVAKIEQWQSASILVAHLADDGGLLEMEVHGRPSATGVGIGEQSQ
jgi:biofilm PGA synthesis protein PgaD